MSYELSETEESESPIRINIRIEIPRGFTKKDIDILFENVDADSPTVTITK